MRACVCVEGGIHNQSTHCRGSMRKHLPPLFRAELKQGAHLSRCTLITSVLWAQVNPFLAEEHKPRYHQSSLPNIFRNRWSQSPGSRPVTEADQQPPNSRKQLQGTQE